MRGEVYLPLADFARLNEQRAAEGQPTFANPRNSAAGSIRQLDPKLAAARPLSIWCYGIGASEGLDLKTHHESLEWLRDHGFKVNRDVALRDDFDRCVEAFREWEERRERLDFEIDGVVVKIDDFEMQRRARRRRARAALGDRVQVLAHDRGHEAASRSRSTSAAPATWSRSRCWSRWWSAA